MSVASEEEAGTELVDRRGDDRRLRGNPRPAVVAEDPAAEARHCQGAFGAAQHPEPVGDFFQKAVGRRGQPFRQRFGPLERLVHDDPPVHDEPDAARGCPLGQWALGLRRERVDGDV